jgi:SAM-dependent methyltransferase
MFRKNEMLEYLVSEFPYHKDSSHSTSAGVWAPSDLKVLFNAFKRIGLGPHHSFLDAGSGDGRVAFLASLFCNNVVGIESDPVMHFISMRKLEKNPLFKHVVKIIKDDYLQHDFSMYDVVFSYPDGEVSEQMREKCINELRSGAVAIFYVYHPSLPNTKLLEKKTPIWLFQK